MKHILSQSQMSIYITEINNHGDGNYNIDVLFKLDQDIDLARLSQAIDKVVVAHPYIKSRLIIDENGIVMLESHHDDVYQTPIIQVDELSEVQDSFGRDYNLTVDQLFRLEIYKTNDGNYLFTSFHHLIMDGMSWKTFSSDLTKAYDGEELEQETVDGFVIAQREEEARQSEQYQESKQWYMKEFDGVAELDSMPLPDLYNDAEEHFARKKKVLDISASEIELLCRKADVTESMVFTATFGMTLSKYTADEKVVYITGYHGHTEKDTRHAITMMTKMHPVYHNLSEINTVVDLLQQTKTQIHNCRKHSCYSFTDMATDLGLRNNISFVYQGTFHNFELVLNGKPQDNTEMLTNTPGIDLYFIISIENGKYYIWLEYQNNKYSDEFVENFFDTYNHILHEICVKETLREVTCSNEQMLAKLDGFNVDDNADDNTETVLSLFKEAAKQHPENIAAVFKEKQYTYKQLDELTDRIGALIYEKVSKVSKVSEPVVSIIIHRNEWMVLASLAALKAGCAYQPLDPSYPQERLNFMVKDADAILLIADPDLRGILNEYEGETLLTDNLGSEICNLDYSLSTLHSSLGPQSLFTLLYTSGSTGAPKGVMLEHRNLVAYNKFYKNYVTITPDSKIAAYASFGFDANMMDIYCTLMNGATLHIIDEDMRLDLEALHQYFERKGITHCFMTTQVGVQYLENYPQSASLQHLCMGGEKLRAVKPELLSYEIHNGYGPSETTCCCSFFTVKHLEPNIPIGTPTTTCRLYVVDKYGHRLPTGAPGELWINGPQVGRGYLNQPEKTAESFTQNPFGEGRVYHSGDIVRYREDGNIEFVGRKDGQVKIRGFRIELKEVESVIRNFAGVKDVTVQAFDDPSGGMFLAAYVVMNNDSLNHKPSTINLDVAALNSFILSHKPSYMVPAVTMQIDSIPLNQNQKVDKRALPQPQFAEVEITAPENDMQRSIRDVIASVLGHDSFGVDTNLFEIGMTSITLLKLNALLATKFDKALKVMDIKTHDTVRKLESLLLASMTAESYAVLDSYPLTQTQMGVFIDSNSKADSVMYNIPLLINLGAGVDVDKLTHAVKAVIDAHPYIKTTLFADADGAIMARRNDAQPAVVSVETLNHVPDGTELVHPFSLLEHPLYRASVLMTPTGNCLFLDFHHIISDGTSLAIFMADIDKAYAGIQLEKESYTGYDVVLDEVKVRTTHQYTEAKEYFASIFTGCNIESMPPRSSSSSTYSVGRITTCFSIPSQKVQAFCDAHNLTMNAFFNAAFGFTMSRFACLDEMVYTTVYNGRNDSRLASTFSMLVKTLPVLVSTSTTDTVTGFIKALQEQLMNSISNDVYSFAELSHEHGIKPDMMFIYQGNNFHFDELCGEKAVVSSLLPPAGKAPLSFSMSIVEGRFELEVEYREDYFCTDFIQAFIDAMQHVVGDFMQKDTLNAVSLLSDTANDRLAIINQTEESYQCVSVNRLFEQQVAAHPERTAVICHEMSLTYDELNRQGNRLAHILQDLGVRTDSVVGMILDRSVLIDVAELGILKAGGAFLGLLPDYPDDRIDYCLTDAASPVVVTTEAIRTIRPQLFGDDKPYRTVILDELKHELREENLDIDIPAESLAYCIYTSGSTGKPKGVMIEHRNLACLAEPADHTYAFYHGNNSGEVSLALSSISFDMSVFDNLLHLLTGRTVCIATDRDIHNPALLAEVMINGHVDTISTTPSVLSNYISIPEFRKAMQQIKTVVCGAEAFCASLIDELRAISPEIHIINGYGPSECTATCCAKHLTSSQAVTIGGPSANTALYVMDKCGNILPPFACGELIICGGLVGRGYVNLPEKTATAFLTLNGQRAYHSGDIVRINGAGEVEFFGRKDNQVKLRGFRVELDEIERSMEAFEGIKQCKVVLRSNGSEDYLVGFFTAGTSVDTSALTEFLKSRLPYYMVPDVMMQIDEIPLTPSGKVNVKALPEIARERKNTKRRAPRKSLEQELCELFANTLSLQEYFADDDFFEMGGTSLSASKVVMQLMSKGFKVEYQDIFDYPTPEHLALKIESIAKPSDDSGKQTSQRQETAGEYDNVLRHNTLEHAALAKQGNLGDVLLTGAVGFLGIHILKELLDNNTGHVTCMVRKGQMSSSVRRLQSMLMYYFDSPYESYFTDRISVIDADITDLHLAELLADSHFDTIINCAAIVKHYSSDNSIEEVNVKGVENLIGIAKSMGARLIQISTVSVAGAHTADTYTRNVKMHENELFVIDDMDNKYCISKYHAELKMLDAIRDGLRGKIIRVGNLMGRHSDGEFQINFNTNAFISGLRGFVTIGKCPISHATDPMRLSPIDLTARAIVLLSTTDDRFTAFNADNRYGFDEMQLIEACNRCGLPIKPVDDNEYYADYHRMLGDSRYNALLQGLLTNDRPGVHMVDTDNLFTTNVLYRLGFSWPLMDNSYLDRIIKSLQTLFYFNPLMK